MFFLHKYSKWGILEEAHNLWLRTTEVDHVHLEKRYTALYVKYEQLQNDLLFGYDEEIFQLNIFLTFCGTNSRPGNVSQTLGCQTIKGTVIDNFTYPKCDCTVLVKYVSISIKKVWFIDNVAVATVHQ